MSLQHQGGESLTLLNPHLAELWVGDVPKLGLVLPSTRIFVSVSLPKDHEACHCLEENRDLKETILNY